jgi:ribosomal-protein-alanine N-acetyltransferase
MALLRDAQRSHLAFGTEDLQRLLAAGDCLVAEVSGDLAGVICASPSRDGYAVLRGLALRDGHAGDSALRALLAALDRRLHATHVTHLAAYGTDPWLAPQLLREGFVELDRIVTLARHPRPVPGLPPLPINLRPAGVADMPQLAALDEATFAPPYRLTPGDLAEALLTSGTFVVAEQDGGHLVGYCSAVVLDQEGQIVRLAVSPAAQGQGIGRAMLNHALAYCHAHAAARVLINTQQSNQASLRLYEGFGFRRTGPRIPLLVRVVSA